MQIEFPCVRSSKNHFSGEQTLPSSEAISRAKSVFTNSYNNRYKKGLQLAMITAINARCGCQRVPRSPPLSLSASPHPDPLCDRQSVAKINYNLTEKIIYAND